MNFLAHLYIADHTETDLAGSVAADFVRGPLSPWPEPLRTAMALHRFVDSYVDQAAPVGALKVQFASEHRRMAGILLDMALDHQLAKQWSQRHDRPLAEFAQGCYRQMQGAPTLPESFKPVLAAMAKTDWLSQYRHRSSIDLALERMSQRLSRPQRLQAAIPEIWRLESAIAEGFERLWPDLLVACEAFVAEQRLTGITREGRFTEEAKR